MSRHHCCRTCAAKRSTTDRRPRRWALTDKGLAAIDAPLPDHVDVPVLTPAALALVADENQRNR
jgi:hypothetical protein